VLNDVLDNDLDFFVLLGFSRAQVRCVTLELIRMHTVFISTQHFDKVEVVARARVSIHDDEAVLKPHSKDAIEELHIGVLIEVLPTPLVLVEQLHAVRL